MTSERRKEVQRSKRGVEVRENVVRVEWPRPTFAFFERTLYYYENSSEVRFENRESETKVKRNVVNVNNGMLES